MVIAALLLGGCVGGLGSDGRLPSEHVVGVVPPKVLLILHFIKEAGERVGEEREEGKGGKEKRWWRGGEGEKRRREDYEN